jgi:TetR/AcrR family transcriptional regulator
VKPTFDRLRPEKKGRIMEAAVDEFGLKGFRAGSTDRIISQAGISKGGLYEYINSKQELYLAAVEYAYDGIYGYLHARIDSGEEPLPAGLIDRLRVVNDYAAEVYIAKPRYLALLAGAAGERENALVEALERIFKSRFDSLFASVDQSRFSYPPEQIFELVRLLLVKTRNAFLIVREEQQTERETVKAYLETWEFYLGVLEGGIYR